MEVAQATRLVANLLCRSGALLNSYKTWWVGAGPGTLALARWLCVTGLPAGT